MKSVWTGYDRLERRCNLAGKWTIAICILYFVGQWIRVLAR